VRNDWKFALGGGTRLIPLGGACHVEVGLSAHSKYNFIIYSYFSNFYFHKIQQNIAAHRSSTTTAELGMETIIHVTSSCNSVQRI
jgi:hypothetical protein